MLAEISRNRNSSRSKTERTPLLRHYPQLGHLRSNIVRILLPETKSMLQVCHSWNFRPS